MKSSARFRFITTQVTSGCIDVTSHCGPAWRYTSQGSDMALAMGARWPTPAVVACPSTTGCGMPKRYQELDGQVRNFGLKFTTNLKAHSPSLSTVGEPARHWWRCSSATSTLESFTGFAGT
jgi:hypothetical protein